MQHTYIKACAPQLNSKVERSHRTDKDEFYQLITYCGDVDLMKKLEAWERFYNFERPHTRPSTERHPTRRCARSYNDPTSCPSRSV